jgi:hypothetical protein
MKQAQPRQTWPMPRKHLLFIGAQYPAGPPIDHVDLPAS